MAERVFQSGEELLQRLTGAQYITHEMVAATLFYAAHMDFPVLLEGDPGCGKTVLAEALARVMETDLITLQCYEGIRPKDAIGRFDRNLQKLYLQYWFEAQENKVTPTDLARAIYTPDFMIKGPILESILRSRRVVFLIDELDKVDQNFEAVLLQLLNDWAVSIPQMAEPLRAVTRPLVIITSNGTREFTDAFLRRVLYLPLKYPAPEQMLEILQVRGGPPMPVLDTQIAGLAWALGSYKLEKPVGVSEMIHLKKALVLAGIARIDESHGEMILPFVAKKSADRKIILEQNFAFADIITHANKCATHLLRARQTREWVRMNVEQEAELQKRIGELQREVYELRTLPMNGNGKAYHGD